MTTFEKQVATEAEPDIYMFKLVSGDTIIARVAADNETVVLVKDAIQVNDLLVRNETGHVATNYLTEWFGGTQSAVFAIDKRNIMAAAIPNVETLRSYVMKIVQLGLNTPKPQPQPIKKTPSKKTSTPKFDQSGMPNMTFKLPKHDQRWPWN